MLQVNSPKTCGRLQKFFTGGPNLEFPHHVIAILSLLVIVTISVLVTRIAGEALMLTGTSRELARFQARSAFTGVGFTTSEAENVVNHPLRRRIILALMLLGNAGVVTAISSLILGFVSTSGDTPAWMKFALLFGGLAVLWVLSMSAVVDRALSRIIHGLLRRYTKLDVRDYASLLHLSGEYRIVEFKVRAQDWIAGKKLAEMKLRDEGVVVLGITRAGGKYIGVPKGPTEVHAEDVLLLYGRLPALERIDVRRKGPAGDQEHKRASREQESVSQTEEGAA